MTVRAGQVPVLALVESEGNLRVGQYMTLVLWQVAGSVDVGQIPVMALYRRIPRRIIGITD